jgi:hypothetical protein
LANQIEILLKATDEASAVLKNFGDNADTALQGTTASAAGTAEGMEALGGAAGLAVSAVAAAVTSVASLGAAFAASLSSLLDYVEGLEKANLSTGVSVEFWQKLIKTGEEMGISFDQMRGSVERMEKALEGTGTALGKFGIDVATFAGLNADEKLRAMAMQIMAIEDPTERAAAAMAAFGRSGAELIPMLAQIVSGAVDAQRVLGTDTVESLMKTKQALEGAETAWKGAKQEIVSFLTLNLPLEGFFNSLKVGIQHLPELAHAISLAVQGRPDLITLYLQSAIALEREGESAHKTSQATLDLLETERKLHMGLAELTKIWEEEEKATAKAEAAQKKLNTELERARKWAIDQISKETAETRKQMEAEAKRIDAAVAGEEKLSAKMAAEEAKQLKAVADKYAKAASAAENYFDHVIAGVNRSSDTEVERAQRVLAETIARRAELLANVEATNAQIAKSNEAVAVAQKALDDAATKARIGNLMLIMDSASSILKSLFGKSKAAAIAAAIIDTIAAIVKTMAAYPWPWSLIPAAAAAAAGYAEVNKIKNTDAGFAQGTPGTSFVDFGAGTATMLHGQEAVVTRAQGESVAAMVADAIDAERRRPRPGDVAARSETQHIHFHLDGREVGSWLMRRNAAGLMPLKAT